MRLALAALLLSVVPAWGECRLGPERVMAGNFTVDLDGEPAPAGNPTLWGSQGAWLFPLTFSAPEGARVRILALSGDLTARLTARGGRVLRDGAYPFAGVLAGIQTRRENLGARDADWGDDGVLVYAQADIGSTGVARVAFREDLRGVENAVLEGRTLWFKVAKYLDESGLATHVELTFSQVRYRFEEGECDGNS